MVDDIIILPNIKVPLYTNPPYEIPMDPASIEEGGRRDDPAPDRFTAQASTAEDIVKSQTVGLVQLSDFRKRRAEAFEHTERDLLNSPSNRFTASATPSGATTPGAISDGVSTPNEQRPKKKKKVAQKSKLTFGSDDEGDEGVSTVTKHFGKSTRTAPKANLSDEPPESQKGNEISSQQKRLGPNASITIAPKAMTKSALRKAAEARDQLKKEFLVMQEAVKATEVVIPFVFYDGTNIPGGACKIKKGEHVWLFLDRSRKVGAELGIGGSEKTSSKREWARISVDDLMLVRGDIIIPHHYDIYYFIVNQVKGTNGRLLFDFTSTFETTRTLPATNDIDDTYDPLSVPGKSKARNNGTMTPADSDLEGSKDDPSFTKVVAKPWFARNKHLWPASSWKEYDAGKDFTNDVRKDAEGNVFFF